MESKVKEKKVRLKIKEWFKEKKEWFEKKKEWFEKKQEWAKEHRVVTLVVFAAIGLLLAYCSYKWVHPKDIPPQLKTSIVMLILALPTMFFIWWSKKEDTKEQIKKSQEQIKNSQEQIKNSQEQIRISEENTHLDIFHYASDVLLRERPAAPIAQRVSALHQLTFLFNIGNLKGFIENITSSGINLQSANFRGANLIRMDLSRADLIGAHLNKADLSGAKLSEANLSGADLTDIKLCADVNNIKNPLKALGLSDDKLWDINQLKSPNLTKVQQESINRISNVYYNDKTKLPIQLADKKVLKLLKWQKIQPTNPPPSPSPRPSPRP